MIYVTHDQVEAMTMADKIVVLNAGVIEQVGSPLDLYEHPRNLFVAEFIGSPKMNILSGSYAADHDVSSIGIRPEHLMISHDSGMWKGTAGISEYLGSDTFIRVDLEGDEETLTVRAPGKLQIAIGSTVYLTPDPRDLHRFDASGLRIT